MQTSLPDHYRLTPKGRRAEDILRSCVHCGFCNATCPTYQLLGDELDGPRGRIYLMKEMLETQQVDPVATTHLDRCLTCRACETTCPSGVAYGELLELSREFQEQHGRRGLVERLKRRWLMHIVPEPARLLRWARLGRAFAWLLPRRLRGALPPAPRKAPPRPVPENVRGRVLLLQGCVQRVATPEVNRALIELLARRGIEVVLAPEESCCGALPLHMGDEAEASRMIRKNLEGLRRHVREVDAIVSTASGCGVTLKDYQRLTDDDELAGDARHFVRKLVDVSEYLSGLDVVFDKLPDVQRVAVHIPCTLQHGQKLGAAVGDLLRRAGYRTVPVAEGHLCCGSAGTYSLLQPRLAERLRERKLAALTAATPDVIVTANVGCQQHLGADASVPVRHWLELLV
jgi:glycolate oxidase iron-sulfur subunit